MRNLVISFAGMAVLAGSALLACSAADPGVADYGPRQHGGAVGSPASTNPGNTPGGNDAGSTPTPGGDSGAPSGNDSGAGPSDAGGDGGGGGGLQPFKGLPAYASKPVATSARTSHQNAGQTAQQPNTDCLTCHVTGGAGVPFLAAGWVATTPGGATGAVDVEVSVYNAALATAFSAHTDSDGFFWINPPNGGATGTFCAGVRQQQETDMPTTQTNYDCQTAACHGGQPIHYP